MLKDTNAHRAVSFFTLLELHLSDGSGEDKIRKLRRRDKELVSKLCIIATNKRNEFGLAQIEQPQHFQAASDVDVVGCR